jgi:hypothetical protein
MHAEKVILETNQQGQIINLPKLPPNAQLEAIFLVLNQSPKKQKRVPSAKIAGKGKITGDIISPVVEADDWDALK